MMISKHLRSHTDENQIKIDLSTIGKFLKIFPVLLIIFTIIYFTCLGCFYVAIETPSQTVTLRSEGPAATSYPDSMGQYGLIEGSLTGNDWYRHMDRDDRFIMYNKFGKKYF